MEDIPYILVVDDNPNNLQMVSAILAEKKYKIALAMNGISALKVLDEITIDLILLDIMMPDMDGYEVCRIVKQNSKTKDIPVIFLTALDETSDIIKAFNSGGVDYITKPIRAQELMARIETHLTISRLQHKLIETNEKLEQTVKLRTSQLIEINEELTNKVQELKTANEIIKSSIVERKNLQQQMTLATIQSEETERTRISQELHDGLGPILTTIKLYLQWLNKPDALKNKAELIDQTIEITDEAIQSVKDISNKLSPSVLLKYGLQTAIESFVSKIRSTVSIKFKIDIRLRSRLMQNIEILLYRVIIECVNNTIKYADAHNVNIEIMDDNQILFVNYSDDGQGFDLYEVKKNKNGLGLINMQNRVETLDGFLKIVSSPGTGMKLFVTIPSATLYID